VRVCYFGTYERAYPRNAQVIACLRKAGVEVVERHVPVWDGRRDNWQAGARAALRLAAAEARLLKADANDADALIVGYPGHLDLPAARRAARGRPVIFNPLLSLADTLVSDRARFRTGSSAARVLERLDRASFGAADLVVADTDAQGEFFRQLTRTPVAVCFVGAEERVFTPGWTPPATFQVLFVGKLIPLQGVDVVLAAARRAPEIRFRIVGSGQLDALLADPPANVVRDPWLPYDELPGALHAAGCALGIFGTSGKARRVIPNKAFQALACGTPLVSADTPAARELLVDGESALLVPPGDPDALVAAVRRVAAEPKLAARLSAGGREAYEQRASEVVLGARWRALVERLLD
jgi:glycosyltransferase involved in cell wall biosynthesis